MMIIISCIIIILFVLIFIFFKIKKKNKSKYPALRDIKQSSNFSHLFISWFSHIIHHDSFYCKTLELENDDCNIRFQIISSNEYSDLHKYTDYVNKFLSELQTGYLLFTPPEKMKLGKQIMLEAILAKQIDLFKKDINLDDLDTLPIATEMGVKLEGDSFEIKELSQQYKIISNSEPTSWFWKIKPTSTGAQDLYLIVSIKLKFENYSDATKETPMYIKTIKVTVNPIYSIKHFFSNNWKWIISTFFGSGIIFVILKSLKIIE